MAPELRPVLLANLADLSSEKRHQIVQHSLPTIKAFAMRLMESGGIPFPAMGEGGQELLVDHEFIMAEFGALVDAGYDISGKYQGVMPPHEAADAADAFLLTLRQRRNDPPTS